MVKNIEIKKKSSFVFCFMQKSWIMASPEQTTDPEILDVLFFRISIDALF